MLEELVFLHRDSGAPVLADPIENFEPSRLPRGMRLLVRLAGAPDPDGEAPLDWRPTYLGRKRIARAACSACSPGGHARCCRPMAAAT